ncbi:mucin-1-like [Pseudonaja textilis]|uniref:mucin-1-like n=1 Tax=Pseudonaja textilis TaxID=8673 RepID=UPI000EA995F0|nr:mucin-1-like [Pseudonaja textilis]XP_026581328.1 mucin-1-like [Pseudonaja textilis]
MGGNETTTPPEHSSTTSSPPTTTTPKSTPTMGGKETTSSEHHSTTSSPPVTSKHTSPHSTLGATPPTTLASTTKPIVIIIFYVNFHIMNREFNSSLEDPKSSYYKELESAIRKMYRNVYKELGYRGFRIISFSQGSVAVESELYLGGESSKTQSQIADALNNADNATTGGLELGQVKVSSNSINTSSETVPGWGIALLVLVSILVFCLLLALLWLLVYYGRRNHRGSMELLNSQDSYHPMNEYPTYQTHSRFAAPTSKQNPYNEVRAARNPKPEAVSGN